MCHVETGACGSQESIVTLELELQKVMSHHGGGGDQARIPWKSSMLSHLSRSMNFNQIQVASDL